MKKIWSIFLIAFLLSISFNFIATDQGNSYIVTTFKDGTNEKIITFTPTFGSDNSSTLVVEQGAPIYEASVNVTGMPDTSGDYPTGLTLDVGDDTSIDWKFDDVGYGSLGKQTLYNDGTKTKQIIIPASNFGNVGKILLPANATVTKATFEVGPGTDSVTIQPPSATGKDAFVNKDSGSSNYGNYGYLQYYSSSHQSFVEFPLTAIPAGVKIDYAEFSVATRWWYQQRTYSVYPVVEQWWENNITWNNRPKNSSVALDTETFDILTTAFKWEPFDVTKAVKNWRNKTWDNYGLTLIMTSGSYDGGYSVSCEGTAAWAPKLVVHYYKYPVDPGIRIGNTVGLPDWKFTGELDTFIPTADLKNEINNYLSTATGKLDKDGNSMVEVPINVSASSGSFVVIRNIVIEYEYTHKIDITGVVNSLSHKDGKDGGYKNIPLRFESTSPGVLKVNSPYIVYNHLPLLQSKDNPSINSIPDYHFDEDVDRTKAIDLAYYFQDDWDENTSLRYGIIDNSNPSKIKVSLNQDEKHYLDVKGMVANWTGMTSVIINCSDSGGREIVANTFEIYLDPVNDKPKAHVTIPDISINEDGKSTPIELDSENYFVDAEGDEILYDYGIDPLDIIQDEQIKVEIDNTNKLVISGMTDYNGQGIPVWIYADDGIYDGQIGIDVAKYGSGKEINYQEIIVDINPMNDPPIWDNIFDIYIDEDVDLDDYLNLDDYVYDIETPNELIEYSVFYNENNSKIKVEIDESNNIDISFVTENFLGKTYVKLEAKDTDNARSYEDFNIIVRPVNDIPKIQIQSHKDGASVHGKDVNLNGIATDVDGYVIAVEIRFDSNQKWEQLKNTDYWNYAWDTTVLVDGPHEVFLRAIDNDGEYSIEYKITLNVANIASNIRPTITLSSPENGTVVASGSVMIRGKAQDQESNVQVVQARIGNGSWHDAEGSIDWFVEINVSQLDNGYHTIYARAFDGISYSEEASTMIRVQNLPKGTEDETGDGGSKKDSSDKFSLANNSFLYIILIIIIVIIVVAAAAGIIVKKKKKEEAMKAETMQAGAVQVPSPVIGAVPGAAQLPAPAPYSPAPTPALPGTTTGAPPSGMPQPIQGHPYQAPAPVPQLPPAQVPAPAAQQPQYSEPYDPSGTVSQPIPGPEPAYQTPAPAPYAQPGTAPPPQAAPAQPYEQPPPQPQAAPASQPQPAPQPQPGAPPAAQRPTGVPQQTPYQSDVIDIQGITIAQEPTEAGTSRVETAHPQRKPMTKPVQDPPKDAFTVDLEYSPETGEYKTVGRPRQAENQK